MNKGDLIVFDSKKNFKYIKSLGAGGTGDTHLFLDETTGIQFAIKKYAPKDFRYVDEYYSRFVDEIIILFNIMSITLINSSGVMSGRLNRLVRSELGIFFFNSRFSVIQRNRFSWHCRNLRLQ